MQQFSLLRDVVLHGSLPGNPDSATKADEEHWRRTRRTFRTEAHYVAGPFFPLGVLPHYVDPRGLRLHRGLLKGARSTLANIGLQPLRVYLKLVASAKTCAQRNVLSASITCTDSLRTLTKLNVPCYYNATNKLRCYNGIPFCTFLFVSCIREIRRQRDTKIFGQSNATVKSTCKIAA